MSAKNFKTLIFGSVAIATMYSGALAATRVDLGSATNFTILSSVGITTTPGSLITGNIGVSPAASTGLIGFNLTVDPSGQFATSSLVNGKVYAADYAAPTPAFLGTAVSAMQAAYTDAAGRSNPDFVNLAAGNLNGERLVPGLYNWNIPVAVTNSVTLSGDANAIWIFQITKRLSLASEAQIILAGGAQTQNIFWQTAEGATFGTNAQFSGILLTATDVVSQAGVSVNGNLFIKTATLDLNYIQPASAVPEPSTYALFSIGGVFLFYMARHKRKTA